MRALPMTVAFVGSLGVAAAQNATAPIVVPVVIEPGPAAAGSSTARPLATAAEAVKASKQLAQQPISSEDARRMMMLLMMRDAASGFPAILLRPAE
jgi:hypothetical protein